MGVVKRIGDWIAAQPVSAADIRVGGAYIVPGFGREPLVVSAAQRRGRTMAIDVAFSDGRRTVLQATDKLIPCVRGK